ncbi:CHC2 zinc finger domain-containing protein [Uliginosibacterium flavum]|uniref:CHC2 zinc finger domain-containing protein n=1 Tax=Uliginosibacterium flavum TaxID=1396831 RepID=A0ABV2TG76_9RHOO
MSIETILSRLDKPRRTGQHSYVACCPSHTDKSPSLTLREMDDGRVLLHCFGGCSIHEVVAALGLTLSDLFPEKVDSHHTQRERRPFPAADILRCIAFEALVVATAGAALLSGHTFSDVDRQRLMLAIGRIQAALTAGGYGHG